MSPRFCAHLEEYGSIYTRAEAAYFQCNSLVERILDTGPDPEILGLLTTSISEWVSGGQELRNSLVNLVSEGKVRIPKGGANGSKEKGSTICSECRQKIPTLTFPAWKLTEQGSIFFEGEELQMAQSASAANVPA